MKSRAALPSCPWSLAAASSEDWAPGVQRSPGSSPNSRLGSSWHPAPSSRLRLHCGVTVLGQPMRVDLPRSPRPIAGWGARAQSAKMGGQTELLFFARFHLAAFPGTARKASLAQGSHFKHGLSHFPISTQGREHTAAGNGGAGAQELDHRYASTSPTHSPRGAHARAHTGRASLASRAKGVQVCACAGIRPSPLLRYLPLR